MPEDTPADRLAREANGQALETSADTVVDPDVGPGTGDVPSTRGRRRQGSESALVASAAMININDKRAVEASRRRRQAWQTEAWDYYDEVGEIAYCADEDTEILTADGWRSYLDVHPGDSILTLNHGTGVAEWEQATEVHRFASQARDMIRVSTRAHDSLTTPNHRWPTLQGAWQDGVTSYRRRWQTTETLTASDRIVTAAPLGNAPTEAKWSDALVEVVGWFWTEGHIEVNAGQTSTRVSIAQSESANPAYCARITAALTSLYGPPVDSLRSGNRRAAPAWRVYRYANQHHMMSFRLNHEAAAPLLAAAPGRVLAPAFLRSLTTAQAKLLVETSVAADGWTRGSSRWVSQSSETRLRGFEMAVILAGLTPHTYESKPGCWVTSISESSYTVVQPKRHKRTVYDGVVWCPVTGNGTWLARRNGSVYFTGNTVNFIANLISKLRIFPAIRLNPEDPPIPVTAEESLVNPEYAEIAVATLQRLRSAQGGQSAILREMALNFEVAGECYLHGHDETPVDPTLGGQAYPSTRSEQETDVEDNGGEPIEDWQIRSVDELVVTGDNFALRPAPGVNTTQPIDSGDIVIRLWERHPRFSSLATCAMRRVLAEAESLLLLSREVRATAKSRLSNGILLVPDEMTIGPADPTRDSGNGGETQDSFMRDLQQAMIMPVQNEGSASSVVPIVLRGPKDSLAAVRHLTLDRAMDPVLEGRIEQRIMRIARGLNMPVEVTTGLMATTFANAEQIKESEFEDHIRPRAVMLVDALTSGYFQWAVEEAGVPAEVAQTMFAWFDASDIIVEEDQAEQVEAAHDKILISDEAYRRHFGFNEDDAPSDSEVLLRVMLNSPRMDPFMFSQLLKHSGLFPDVLMPAPPAGVYGDTNSVSAMPVAGTPAATSAPSDGAPVTSTAPVTAAADQGAAWKNLGHVLAQIDRDLRTRIIAAADQAMRAAIDRAGNKIRSKFQRTQGTEAKIIRAAADAVAARDVAAEIGPAVLHAAGVTESSLLEQAFDQLATDARGWMDAAFAQALAAIQKATGPFTPARLIELHQAHDRNTARACTLLRTNLVDLAGSRLYAPVPPAPTLGEHDPTIIIPASLVRMVLAVAGGATVKGGNLAGGVTAAGAWISLAAGPVTSSDGTPLGGIATGPNMMDVVAATGGSVEGYQWDYGLAGRAPFEPHEDLDGSVVSSLDDPDWANTGDFPETDFYFPGDHDGCTCDIVPVLIGPDGDTTDDDNDDATVDDDDGSSDDATTDDPTTTDSTAAPAGAVPVATAGVVAAVAKMALAHIRATPSDPDAPAPADDPVDDPSGIPSAALSDTYKTTGQPTPEDTKQLARAFERAHGRPPTRAELAALVTAATAAPAHAQ